jgi:hypothetical protein
VTGTAGEKMSTDKKLETSVGLSTFATPRNTVELKFQQYFKADGDVLKRPIVRLQQVLCRAFPSDCIISDI